VCVSNKMSSRTEQITSEVRRLVLTARSLQAQLDQSIPKKTHEEIVARMQGTIDGMSAELRRTKSQLGETQTIGEGLSLLGKQVSAQGETVREVVAKLAEVTVPNTVYQQATTKISELEQIVLRKDQEIQGFRETTVPKEQYTKAEARISELEAVLANSMPKAEFEDLSQQIDSIAKAAPSVNPGLGEVVLTTSSSTTPAPQPIPVVAN
jgi:hypothetical protein